MQKAKKICCRITPRRVIGAIVLAASTVNLIIVGAAFEVSSPISVPTLTSTQTIHPATLTFFAPTATAGESSLTTLSPTDVLTYPPTFTLTHTSTVTATQTSTPTDTSLPSPTPCIPIYAWPVYIVQRGDTLFALAQATGSSDEQLRMANCLPDSRIYVGQQLHVPRLPIYTPTPSMTLTSTLSATPTTMPSATSTATPTFTPTFTYTPETPIVLFGCCSFRNADE